MKPRFEVADVLKAHWDHIALSGSYNSWQLRTLHAISSCRTAAMGGHIDKCDHCNHIRISYNSCRNRHCPKCQVVQRERWILAREGDLLPVPYFHVVFTLPDSLNPLCMHAPKKVYDLLFATAWKVLEGFGNNHKHLGAQMGMIAILHTWGQNLSLHPHLHCIVPGGGLTQQNKWRPARGKGRYLFDVTAMSKVFRAKFVAGVRSAFPGQPKSLYDALFKQSWVVFANQPFAGPKQVIEYLGRYTHKIAISNHRIQSIENDIVTFSFKDYRDAAKKKKMPLPALEFIRRFAMHILPKRFVRIRHYGILSCKRKTNDLIIIHQQFNSVYVPAVKKTWQQVSIERLRYNPIICPCCKKATMRMVMEFDHRGPPPGWEQLLK